jgi:N-acetylglucosamine kinase-like BadF-type ATPase
VSLVLAVDGGNTKTLAVVAGVDGRVCGAGRGGCSDIYNAPSPEHALRAIEVAVAAALTDAGVGAGDVEAAAFSLAGADWPEDFVLLEGALRSGLGLRVAPLVVNDALGALRGGAPDWTGVAVVSGTYNAIGARRSDGRVFHLGFWPDGAGGRDLARLGLRAVYHAELGMGPATALTSAALELWDAADPLDLLHAFTRRGGLPPGEEDRLAPLVLDAADAGDAVAQAIVAGMGRTLGLQARASAARVGLPLAGTRVVLTGGVFGHPTDRLAEVVMAELPGAEPARHGLLPIGGALLLALDRLGVFVDAAVVAAGLMLPPADERSARWAASASSA